MIILLVFPVFSNQYVMIVCRWQFIMMQNYSTLLEQNICNYVGITCLPILCSVIVFISVKLSPSLVI